MYAAPAHGLAPPIPEAHRGYRLPVARSARAFDDARELLHGRFHSVFGHGRVAEVQSGPGGRSPPSRGIRGAVRALRGGRRQRRRGGPLRRPANLRPAFPRRSARARAAPPDACAPVRTAACRRRSGNGRSLRRRAARKRRSRCFSLPRIRAPAARVEGTRRGGAARPRGIPRRSTGLALVAPVCGVVYGAKRYTTGSLAASVMPASWWW